MAFWAARYSRRDDAIENADDRQRRETNDDRFYAVVRDLWKEPKAYCVVRYDLASGDEVPWRGDNVSDRAWCIHVSRQPGKMLPLPSIERDAVPVEIAAMIALDGWAA